jgi:peptidoglycan/LPS O-acetylase OafA/YrhL
MQTRRLADLEWLRVAGMLLVFAIHAAQPFNPWDTWHIVSPSRSKWLGELVLFPAPWIMPLFMVLAGKGAWHALERRTPREYLHERLLRLALPLAAGILVLVPPQVYLERRLRGQFGGSLLAFYPHFFTGIYPRGNLSWHHLWFLVFLLVFAIVTLPLFAWLRGRAGRRLMARLAAPCDAPGGLAWLVLPLVAVRLGVELASAGAGALAYDWSDRVLLLPGFVFGFMLAGEAGFQRALARHWPAALGIALALSAALFAWSWPGAVLARIPSPRSPGGVLLWGGYTACASCWIVACLGAARRFLTRAPPAVERASAMVLPFYVLHHPVIVAVAFIVVRAHLGVAPAFLLLASASLAATLALCWSVESSGALRPLFGLRRRPLASAQGRGAA